MPSPLEICRIIELPVVTDPRGSLTFVEGERHIPFDIRRVYYLYDVPAGATRGGHAHKALQQVLIAMTGNFDVELDDGREKRKFHLDRRDRGLYVSPMVWRELRNFSPGAVSVALVSLPHDESDYYRDYQAFLDAVEAAR